MQAKHTTSQHKTGNNNCTRLGRKATVFLEDCNKKTVNNLLIVNCVIVVSQNETYNNRNKNVHNLSVETL